MKRDIIDETAITCELEEWFSERKATLKMETLVRAMFDAAERSEFEATCVNIDFVAKNPLRFSSFPTMAKLDSITEDGRITALLPSNAFYSVHHWISENKPIYDLWRDNHKNRKLIGLNAGTVRSAYYSNIGYANGLLNTASIVH